MSLLVGLLVLASPPSLERAAKDVSVLKFKQAAASLDATERLNDLPREDVLRYFELRARVASALGRDAEATRAFEALLELEPKFSLKGRASPKLTSPLFEARATIDRRGALEVGLVFADHGGALESVAIELRGPTERVERVRVSVQTESALREVVMTRASLKPVPLSGKKAKVTVLLEGARAWQLLTKTQSYTAKADEAPSAPPSSPPLTPAPEPVRASSGRAPPAVVTQVAPRAHTARTLGIIGLGAGAASAAVGVAFFAVGSSARATFDRAVAMQMNGVVPLTVVEAERLSADVTLGRTGSTVAWVSAGVLIVAGALLWLLDAL